MIKSKQPDPIYPLLLAFQKAEFCEQIVARARELSDLLDMTARNYAKLGFLMRHNFKTEIERIDAEKRKLLTLILKATATGVTITIQVKTLYEWMNDVREGVILDVFTMAGQQAAKSQLEETARFLQASMKRTEAHVQQYMRDHPVPKKALAAPAANSSIR